MVNLNESFKIQIYFLKLILILKKTTDEAKETYKNPITREHTKK